MKEIKLTISYHKEFGLEKRWGLDKFVHRNDGPALFIPWDGMKYYYLHGYQVDKEKYSHTLDEQVLGW